MSDTPRTDAYCCNGPAAWRGVDGLATLARQLERDLKEALTGWAKQTEMYEQAVKERDDAREKLSKLSRLIDLASKANDEATENQVANSAEFAEAIAYQHLDLAEAQRDEWKACAEELAEAVEAAPCKCGYCCKCRSLTRFNNLKGKTK